MIAKVSNYRTVPGLLTDWFKNDWLTSYNADQWYHVSTPAVNIAESKESYRVEVAAPGLSKEDFKVNVDNGILTISSEKEKQKEEVNEKYTRKEFNYGSFKRSFTLPDEVEIEKISANHKDGVLNIFIPKKEPVSIPVKDIEIS